MDFKDVYYSKADVSRLTVDEILLSQRIKTVQEHIIAELHEYQACTRTDNIYGLDQEAKELLEEVVESMCAPLDVVMTIDTLNVLKKLAGMHNPSPEIYFSNMFEPINNLGGEYFLRIQPLRRDKKNRYVMINPETMDKYVKKSFKDNTERN